MVLTSESIQTSIGKKINTIERQRPIQTSIGKKAQHRRVNQYKRVLGQELIWKDMGTQYRRVLEKCSNTYKFWGSIQTSIEKRDINTDEY